VGRPPLPIGTAGKTLFLSMRNGQIQARAKFRDFDGRIRLVSKTGRSGNSGAVIGGWVRAAVGGLSAGSAAEPLIAATG
jgi:hypothetical protein